MASPISTRPTISTGTDHARAHSKEPAIKTPPPKTKDHLRPVCRVIHPAPTAPTAAPAIMALTIHSCARVDALKSRARKSSAPEITPISNPDMRPAVAARTPTTTTFMGTVLSAPFSGIAAFSIYCSTLFFWKTQRLYR